MPSSRALVCYSLIASLVPFACLGGEGPSSEEPFEDAMEGSAADAEASLDLGRAVLRHTANGRVFSVFHRDRSPLFHFPPDRDPEEGLQAFARANAVTLGLAPARSDERITTIALDRAIDDDGVVRVHRFRQSYRGHRIVGAGETLAVTSTDGGRALSVMGAFVDERVDLDGLEEPISADEARRIMAETLGEDVHEDLELVAAPDHGVMAWFAEIERDAPHHLLVSAVDGTILMNRAQKAHDAFNHAYLPAVRTYATTNNPGTTAQAAYPSFGSTWDGSFSPLHGWLVRMGDDRALVYDMELDNGSVPTTYLVPQYFPTGQPYQWAGLNSMFLATPASDANLFRTQNFYQKMRTALTELDARQSGLGWDHHPSMPIGVFTPAPVTLFTHVDSSPEAGEPDRCNNGSSGVYNACKLTSAAMQPAYPNDWSSCIYMCNTKLGTLLHELGHHVDNHATYGFMGSSVSSNTCVHDTPDEAVALAETIGDMTALYLARKLYPSLPYNFSTATSPCTFNSIGQGKISVHDPSCLRKGDTVGWFDDDRPASSVTRPCDPKYRIRSVNQAVWAWINRQFCDDSYPFNCVTTLGGDHQMFMRGMIYAMTLSNAQSYETFFENIETYIWVSLGQTEADYFRYMMSIYGILDP